MLVYLLFDCVFLGGDTNVWTIPGRQKTSVCCDCPRLLLPVPRSHHNGGSDISHADQLCSQPFLQVSMVCCLLTEHYVISHTGFIQHYKTACSDPSSITQSGQQY